MESSPWGAASAQPVLLATLGGRQSHNAFPSIFDGLAREHSRKPAEVCMMVVERAPDQDRCDLFGRETRPASAAGATSTVSSIGLHDVVANAASAFG
jgi:N6-adenosine-specific RNA methylase IME4